MVEEGLRFNSKFRSLSSLTLSESKPERCRLHLAYPGHFAGEDVKAKLAELHGRWDTLKSKASQRRQDLEDSLQAQQYFADANEAESWMREKEPIVGSTDYGKDEDSAEVRG